MRTDTLDRLELHYQIQNQIKEICERSGLVNIKFSQPYWCCVGYKNKKGLNMCGLAGIISLFSSNFDKRYFKLDVEEIIRRGPDSYGNYFDKRNLNEISIAHRRLSIIDLSEKGNQPMKSKNGRYVIAFNGEVYNHKSIKGN